MWRHLLFCQPYRLSTYLEEIRVSWLSKCTHGQPKYSATGVATTALLLSQNGLRSYLRSSNFKKFPGGACPHTSLVLHVYACIHAYMQVRHSCTCNPPSKIPGCGPVSSVAIWKFYLLIILYFLTPKNLITLVLPHASRFKQISHSVPEIGIS